MKNTATIMEAGKAFFMLNVPSQEIARTLGVSENTVSAWVQKGGWRDERASSLATKKTIQDNLLNLIDYQLEALNEQVKLNRSVGDIRPLDKAEVDALSKLFATVKGKELTFAALVTVVRELVEFLSTRNPDLAKALVPYTNDFVLAKKETLV